jgi:hypothetical protein
MLEFLLVANLIVTLFIVVKMRKLEFKVNMCVTAITHILERMFTKQKQNETSGKPTTIH